LADAEQLTLSRLRSMILDGSLEAGQRLSEVIVAQMFGVSRTPAKLALTRLEMTGLVTKLPGRGYEVRKVHVRDLESLLALRGVLEGTAAAAMARNGMSATTQEKLSRSIEMSDEIVRRRKIVPADIDTYQQANALFHETIMTDCGNEYVLLAYEPIRHLPLAALATHAPDYEQLDREILRISVGHAQHVIIREAILKGDATRAELVMREHSNATLEYARLFVGEMTEEHIPMLMQSV